MRPARLGLVALLLAFAMAATACSAGATPEPSPLPSPTCGGLKILVPGALPCEQLVGIAVGTLRERSPEQVARGITAIDVSLELCPVGEMPPLIDCGGVTYAQMVRLSFGPAPAGGPIEEYLVVALEPVTGRLLGIENPLIR